jgi:two-component system LytT family response regulator
MTLRVLVADDEAVARRRIRRYLSADEEVTLIGESADGAAAVDAIRALAPDVVFLDVQMPELDGFEVLRALGSAPLPAVVFVTAFDRYALQAFDLHAIDYLLKPFTRERFDLALSRAKARAGRPDADIALATLLQHIQERPHHPSRVAVRQADRLVVIDWADVDWIEAADNYAALHTRSAEYLLRSTMAALEQELDPGQFVRIHRSTIVRIDRIAELYPESHGDFTVRLRSGQRLAMSRTFRDRVAHAIRWSR